MSKAATMSNRHKNNGLLVPPLRFPEFQDAWEWTETTVGKLLTESCQIGSKGDKAKKLTVKLWGKGVFEKEETSRGSVNTQYYRRSSGQFIYSKLDFLNQAFGIIPKHLDGFESTVDLPCFDLSADVVSIFFLEYVKREEFYKKHGEIADGGRKAKRIQVDNFLSFPIVLPPQVKEQQKIADCLSSLDERIAAETNELDALKAHKNGLLKQLFPAEGETLPALRFPEFRDAGEWEEELIESVAEVATGNKDTQDKVDGGAYPFFVRSQQVESIDAYALDCEAVLTSGDGVGVGKNFHYIEGKFNFHQRVYCIYNFSENVSGKFFFYFFSEKFYKHVMKLSAKNSVDSVRRAMITELSIMIPSLKEQQRIADCLSSLDELISAQTQKIELLKAHKKGLMQQLFPEIDEAKV